MQKALVFVSRCQNLKSEFNDQPWAGKVNDGGFVYTAANGGHERGRQGRRRRPPLVRQHDLRRPQEHDLRRPDPATTPASRRPYDYITKHYTLDENPGLGQQGLYYYYQTFAKALALLGKPTLVDAAGKSHDWRAELVAALAKRQNADGSWVNPADRFMEGDPNLVTAYALLALAYTRRNALDEWNRKHRDRRDVIDDVESRSSEGEVRIMSDKPNVFVSYAHEDRRLARSLIEELEVAGISTWSDELIQPGENWVERIERAITMPSAWC